MTTLAHVVRVVRKGATTALTIDGEEFPWFVAEAGVTVSVNPSEAPGVTFTLLAERVEVEDEEL